MNTALPEYTDAEIAQRGHEIYRSAVGPQVEGTHHGEIVAIDVETGEFEIGQNSLMASDRLLDRYPNAQIWLERVGHRAVHRIGFVNPSVVQ
jgi:hypothetical protein